MSFGFDAGTVQLTEVIISSFQKTDGKGLPLGNVTSQLFANIYLNEFDWWVKQNLKIKHYFRYCDDFVILLPDKNSAQIIISHIKERLKLYALELHPQKLSVRKVRQGIDFLGYVIVPHAVLLRTKTKKRIYKKIETGMVMKQSVLESYLGVSTYAKSRLLTEHLLKLKSIIDK